MLQISKFLIFCFRNSLDILVLVIDKYFLTGIVEDCLTYMKGSAHLPL